MRYDLDCRRKRAAREVARLELQLANLAAEEEGQEKEWVLQDKEEQALPFNRR